MSSPSDDPTRRRWMRTALVVLAAVGVSVGMMKGVHAPGPDYWQFWTIGRAMPVPSYFALHRTEIPHAWTADRALARAQEAGTTTLYLTATPLYYTVFAVTSMPDFSRSLRLFQIASFAIFVGGLVMLLRAWRYSADAICVVIAGYFLAAAPLYDDVWHANVSRLYVGLVALWLCVIRSRRVAIRTAGAQALLGLLVLFKPFLALALPALLLLRMITGRWRTIAYELTGFGGGVALGLALPSIVIGMPVTLWSDFIAIQTHYLENGDYQAPGFGDASGVETLTDALHLSVWQFALLVGALTLITAIVVLSVHAGRTAARQRDDAAEIDDAELSVLLSAGGFLIVSPLVWPHYYLFATVLALHLLRAGPAAPPWSRLQSTALAIGLLLLAAFPLAAVAGWALPSGALEPEALVNGQLALGGAIVGVCGLVEYGRRLRRGGNRLVATRMKMAMS